MLAGAPREVGGLELAPGLALRCAEEIARGDSSAGWCVSIAATSSLLAAYLPAESRAELFDDPQGIAAGVWAPRGNARPGDGGVVVSGRWAYCSGISHAAVFFAGCMIDNGRGPTGAKPTPSVVAIPQDELEILDTWHTLGLRGTGSHDVVAGELFVPTARAFSLLDGPACRPPAIPLPDLWLLRAVDRRGRAGQRPRHDRGVRGAGRAQDRAGLDPHARTAPGNARGARPAEASLRAARAVYYEAIEAAWEAAQEQEPVPVARRNDLRLAATHAVRTSAEVVRSLFDLGGGSAIYDDSPLQRRFRDAHTATAHFQVNAASRELPGRILLDQQADTALL